jgi:hypothetical protein
MNTLGLLVAEIDSLVYMLSNGLFVADVMVAEAYLSIV